MHMHAYVHSITLHTLNIELYVLVVIMYNYVVIMYNYYVKQHTEYSSSNPKSLSLCMFATCSEKFFNGIGSLRCSTVIKAQH